MEQIKDYFKFKEYLKSLIAEREKAIRVYCDERGIEYKEKGLPGRENIENAYNDHIAAEKRKQDENFAKIAAENAFKAKKRDLEYRFKTETPPRYLEASITDFSPGKAINGVLAGDSALILGTNGCGKTRLAYAMGKEWVSKGEDFRVVKAQELLSELKGRDDAYKYIKEKYFKYTHLVVDEIDKVYESKADFLLLNSLVDIRYEWNKQTVFMGNSRFTTREAIKQGFIASFGESLFSRLCGEADGGHFIVINSKDRRFLTHEDIR